MLSTDKHIILNLKMQNFDISLFLSIINNLGGLVLPDNTYLSQQMDEKIPEKTFEHYMQII